MLILVTAGNFLQMFVGWEGVGLSSYLLINFWHTRIQANKAAIKAMLFNRVADMFMLLGLFSIYLVFETFDYQVIFAIAPLVKNLTITIGLYNPSVLDFICLFLFLGAMGKSAQFGFHNWLPDAMEGPTPVSALIHAATMVTAGIFLLIRCSYLYEISTSVLQLVAIIGSITAILGLILVYFHMILKK
jgi:NADH-quinone oxidoreductase subunit L